MGAPLSWPSGPPASFRLARPCTFPPSASTRAAEASSWGRIRSKADSSVRAAPRIRPHPCAVFPVMRALIRASFTPRARAAPIRLGHSSLSTSTPSDGRQWFRNRAVASGPSTGAY